MAHCEALDIYLGSHAFPFFLVVLNKEGKTENRKLGEEEGGKEGRKRKDEREGGRKERFGLSCIPGGSFSSCTCPALINLSSTVAG